MANMVKEGARLFGSCVPGVGCPMLPCSGPLLAGALWVGRWKPPFGEANCERRTWKVLLKVSKWKLLDDARSKISLV